MLTQDGYLDVDSTIFERYGRQINVENNIYVLARLSSNWVRIVTQMSQVGSYVNWSQALVIFSF